MYDAQAVNLWLANVFFDHHIDCPTPSRNRDPVLY
jgi:hypothetical protein